MGEAKYLADALARITFGISAGIMILVGLVVFVRLLCHNPLPFEGIPLKNAKIEINKEFIGKKPHSTIRLTEQGRAAYREYKNSFQQVLNDLPD